MAYSCLIQGTRANHERVTVLTSALFYVTSGTCLYNVHWKLCIPIYIKLTIVYSAHCKSPIADLDNNEGSQRHHTVLV